MKKYVKETNTPTFNYTLQLRNAHSPSNVLLCNIKASVNLKILSLSHLVKDCLMLPPVFYLPPPNLNPPSDEWFEVCNTSTKNLNNISLSVAVDPNYQSILELTLLARISNTPLSVLSLRPGEKFSVRVRAVFYSSFLTIPFESNLFSPNNCQIGKIFISSKEGQNAVSETVQIIGQLLHGHSFIMSQHKLVLDGNPIKASSSPSSPSSPSSTMDASTTSPPSSSTSSASSTTGCRSDLLSKVIFPSCKSYSIQLRNLSTRNQLHFECTFGWKSRIFLPSSPLFSLVSCSPSSGVIETRSSVTINIKVEEGVLDFLNLNEEADVWEDYPSTTCNEATNMLLDEEAAERALPMVSSTATGTPAKNRVYLKSSLMEETSKEVDACHASFLCFVVFDSRSPSKLQALPIEFNEQAQQEADRAPLLHKAGSMSSSLEDAPVPLALKSSIELKGCRKVANSDRRYEILLGKRDCVVGGFVSFSFELIGTGSTVPIPFRISTVQDEDNAWLMLSTTSGTLPEKGAPVAIDLRISLTRVKSLCAHLLVENCINPYDLKTVRVELDIVSTFNQFFSVQTGHCSPPGVPAIYMEDLRYGCTYTDHSFLIVNKSGSPLDFLVHFSSHDIFYPTTISTHATTHLCHALVLHNQPTFPSSLAQFFMFSSPSFSFSSYPPLPPLPPPPAVT